MAGTVARARLSIVAIAAGILLAVFAATPAWAGSTDDLLEVDAALVTAVDDFVAVYSDQSAPHEDVVAAAETFGESALTAQSGFERIAADADDSGIAGYAKEFAAEAGDMAAASDDIVEALNAQDTAALTAAENSINSALDAYSATAEEYNAYVPATADPAFVVWLIILVIAAVLLGLALLFALLMRNHDGLLPAKTDKKGVVHQTSLKRLRWLLVLSTGVFVVGAAIPFFQVVFAQPDATGSYTYTVFWYPLALGAIMTVVFVVQYIIAAAKVRRDGSAPAHDAHAALNDPNAAAAAGYPGAPAVPPLPQAGEPGVPAVPQPAEPVVPAAPEAAEPAPAEPAPAEPAPAEPAAAPEPPAEPGR